MKRDALISSRIKELNKARTEYIDAQLKAESGLTGTLRKTGLKSIKKDKGLGYLVKAQQNYYGTLDRYRKLMINDFKRANRRIIQNDIKLLARITIFDEIEKLRKEKEKKLRNQGLKGMIRAQLQEWREISPNIKMVMGLVLGFIAVLLNFTASATFWFQAPLLGWGLIIFFEGAQQKLTSQKAIKEGKNRLAIYQLANKKLAKVKKDLAISLAKIHQDLEADIWDIRVFEKKTEYRRYLVAGSAGALIGSVYLIPYGLKAIIYTTVAAVVGRATWFILPYDAIKEGFASMFHGAPIPEAMASTRAENEMTDSANFDGTNLTVDQQDQLLYQGGQTGIYESGGEFGYDTLPFEQEHTMIDDPNYNEFGGTSAFGYNAFDSGNPAMAANTNILQTVGAVADAVNDPTKTVIDAVKDQSIFNIGSYNDF
ncbi:MAG: hypothetical protein U9Q72_02660, partial [Patescibacteria group bacterium]|nr:hypothetical protein [Patescibacteria group bacterium]